MDLYIILGLERQATLGQIKRAYKRLARRYHPDINPGDAVAAAQFRQIAEALKGKSLTSMAMVDLLVQVTTLLPEDVRGLSLSVERDGDDNGCSLVIELLPGNRTGKQIVKWNTNETIIIAGERVSSTSDARSGGGWPASWRSEPGFTRNSPGARTFFSTGQSSA